VDWWAFGVLLYEMLVGQSPFSGADEDELFWSICNEPVHFPRFLSKEAKAVLERVIILHHSTHTQTTNEMLVFAQLLEKDTSRRLGMTTCAYGDIKNQVFFYSIDWDKLERRELEPPFRPKLVSHTQS
jgi:novel protein kinase C delta type